MYPTASIYPNSFDMLTTHGIIAEDLVGYVTDTPSPYLQNYVAQRGWNPTLPGQVLPDPLPNVKPQQPLPKDVYQPVLPKEPEKKDKYSTVKKLAAAALILGLGTFGIIKGSKWISNFIKKNPPSNPSGNTPWYKKFGDWISKPFKTQAGQKPWYQKFGDWVSKPFKSTPGHPSVFKRIGDWFSGLFK